MELITAFHPIHHPQDAQNIPFLFGEPLKWKHKTNIWLARKIQQKNCGKYNAIMMLRREK